MMSDAQLNPDLSKDLAAVLSDLLTLMAEIRLDLLSRRDYAIQLEIRLRDQDRRLETAHGRLTYLLRKIQSETP